MPEDVSLLLGESNLHIPSAVILEPSANALSRRSECGEEIFSFSPSAIFFGYALHSSIACVRQQVLYYHSVQVISIISLLSILINSHNFLEVFDCKFLRSS